MKTLAITLITFLTLSVNILFAGNERDFMAMNKEMTLTTMSLSPVTPKEATFEDFAGSVSSVSLDTKLAPVTPKEASFELDNEMMENSINLSPVTPNEADFSETDTVTIHELNTLAPVTPAFADFE